MSNRSLLFAGTASAGLGLAILYDGFKSLFTERKKYQEELIQPNNQGLKTEIPNSIPIKEFTEQLPIPISEPEPEPEFVAELEPEDILEDEYEEELSEGDDNISINNNSVISKEDLIEFKENNEGNETLLPNETYLDYYYRLKKMNIDEHNNNLSIAEQGYQGDNTEASKKQYLHKQAYLKGRQEAPIVYYKKGEPVASIVPHSSRISTNQIVSSESSSIDSDDDDSLLQIKKKVLKKKKKSKKMKKKKSHSKSRHHRRQYKYSESDSGTDSGSDDLSD